MNCLTARETLDVIRPHEIDADRSQQAIIDDAVQHVKGCPACQIAVRHREQIDDRIGRLARDVPVPDGLRERLLALLDAASGSGLARSIEITPGSPAIEKPLVRPAMRSGRRRLIVAALAACVLAASGLVSFWLVTQSRDSLTLDKIAEFALSPGFKPDDLPELTHFQGGLALQHPNTMRTLPWSQPVRRLVDPQLGDHEVGIYFFALSRRRGGTFKGRLVIVPAASVKDLPAETSFFAGRPLYKLSYCTTAWVEGQFVYLCCVTGGEAELLLLRPTRADPA